MHGYSSYKSQDRADLKLMYVLWVTGFPDRVLPGMLCASLFPAIIGSEFPGALYLTQTLKFRQTALVSMHADVSSLHLQCSLLDLCCA